MWTLDTRVEIVAPDLAAYVPTSFGRRAVAPLLSARDTIAELHLAQATAALATRAVCDCGEPATVLYHGCRFCGECVDFMERDRRMDEAFRRNMELIEEEYD